MLQFDLQFYEELAVARVKTVKFIRGAFFLADRSACLFLQRGCRTFTVLFAYKNRTPDVTLWKLNTVNVRRTQITKIKESTVYRTHEKAQ